MVTWVFESLVLPKYHLWVLVINKFDAQLTVGDGLQPPSTLTRSDSYVTKLKQWSFIRIALGGLTSKLPVRYNLRKTPRSKGEVCGGVREREWERRFINVIVVLRALPHLIWPRYIQILYNIDNVLSVAMLIVLSTWYRIAHCVSHNGYHFALAWCCTLVWMSNTLRHIASDCCGPRYLISNMPTHIKVPDVVLSIWCQMAAQMSSRTSE